MKFDHVYLGTWFPRTTLHLKELYRFLKNKSGVEGLRQDKIRSYWEALDLKSVSFHEGKNFDHLDIQCRDIDISLTEDGAILFRYSSADYHQAVKVLGEFYTKSFGPALNYLFSRGAPIPKQLTNIEEVYPLILLTSTMTSHDIAQKFFQSINETCVSSVSSRNLTIYYGTKSNVVNFKQPTNKINQHFLNDLLITIVFFREFENLLAGYISSHRLIWDEISKLRESNSLRYSDFPMVRYRMLDFLKTLSFGMARLEQMDDIIAARQKILGDDIKQELAALSIDRFEHLQSDRKYVSHLWQMTIEYAQGTLNLLELLFEENTQRELSALKFITLIGALAGFFGMNIAFPWEERWPMIFSSSVWVVIIIGLAALAFYYILKLFVYNRRFEIKKPV